MFTKYKVERKRNTPVSPPTLISLEAAKLDMGSQVFLTSFPRRAGTYEPNEERKGRNTGNRPKGGRKRIRKKLEDEEEETRKKTGNEMEPPNAYLGIACLLVAPLVLPVSFFLLPPIFHLPSFSLPSFRARRKI